MKKSIDFSNGVRGKHVGMNLEIVGEIKNVWAVCIEETEKDLIPLKLYRIEISGKSENVKVKNEKGETAVYPKDWFVPLEISSKTVGLLKKVV